MTEKEKDLILNNINKDIFYNRTDHFIKEVRIAHALARWAGLRRFEICRNITWEDIDFENDIINIPMAKEGKNQRVPLSAKLKEFLLPLRGEGIIVNIHPDTLTHALGRAKNTAGIKKRGSVHIYRHSLGTDLKDKDVDLRDIQGILRHSNISTTTLYTQLSVKRLKEILDKK